MRDVTQQYEIMREIIASWDLNPFFVTITGVDLYGFASPDSDYDVRGAYMPPVREILSIWSPKETITRLEPERGLDMDLVFHSLRKFGSMLAEGNAAILEEAYSPLVLMGKDVTQELCQAARGCISKRIFFHYNGFSRSQIDKLWKEEPRRIKTLLYIYRILMTGIHALETGEIECNLPRLNERFQLSFLPELIAAKVTELEPVGEADWELHRKTIRHLQQQLRRAYRSSQLPSEPQNLDQLDDLVFRLRRDRLFDSA